MTFEEYAKEQGLYFTEDYVSDEFQIAQAAWDAAMNTLAKAHQIRPRGKSITSGYVLVPVEPTKAMEEAFLDIYERRGWFMRGYKNMIQAAQESE